MCVDAHACQVILVVSGPTLVVVSIHETVAWPGCDDPDGGNGDR